MVRQIEYLTQEGFRAFESELNFLRAVRRTEIAQRLHDAREEGGEPSENAEYEEAKHEQAFVEGRILELETLLSRATLIDGQNVSSLGMMVCINSRVVVLDQEGTPQTFHIVGRAEANPHQGKISDQSPLGQALLGRAIGDTIIVKAPDGPLEFSILNVMTADTITARR